MKIFATSLIHQLDNYTIEHEPIDSINLMERAADSLFAKFIEHFSTLQSICIFAGPGNNGGDALALARKLLQTGYSVQIILIHPIALSPDCEINRQRLLETFPNQLTELNKKFIAPVINKETVIIDGLFGSGLSRPLTAIFANAVEWINESGCEVVALDIPSGLSGEENKLMNTSLIVKANLTLTLQFPKLSFFFAENSPFVGKWEILNISIQPKIIDQTSTDFFYLEKRDVLTKLKTRSKFSHKGTFGHALIVAGSNGMAGASVLSAKAAMRSGVGLVTVLGPECNRIIVQASISEAIFKSNSVSELVFETYQAVAIGPGISIQDESTELLKNLLIKMSKPCILDADALNIISQHKDLLQYIPTYSILTPHPKEFDRLFGTCNSSYERMIKAKQESKMLGVIIVLKGAHTLIAVPDGKLFFNSTGNSGMATAGSGDVLTGVLVGLLAQGYSPEDTAKIGVFLHGHAGDLALEDESGESLIASDIIERLGKAFNSIRN